GTLLVIQPLRASRAPLVCARRPRAALPAALAVRLPAGAAAHRGGATTPADRRGLTRPLDPLDHLSRRSSPSLARSPSRRRLAASARRQAEDPTDVPVPRRPVRRAGAGPRGPRPG